MKREFLLPTKEIIGLKDKTTGDFWSWAYSDILDNTVRPIFAEFVVGSTLGALTSPRREWDAYDLDYKKWKIEVKSAGYLQSWQTDKPSNIIYNIAKSKPWYAETNTYSKTACRPADCYVFCLLAEKNPQKLNVLDIDQWQFWVMTTKKIETILGDQKSISLSGIEKLAELVSLDRLADMIEELMGVQE